MRWFSFFVFWFAIVAQTNCYCDINISYLIDLNLINSKHVRILQDLNFQSLKIRVLRELENSWCSQDKARLLMDFIVLERPLTCVEIGVFNGDSFLPAAAAIKFLGEGDIYAIDPWSNEEATKNMSESDPNRDWWLNKVDLESIYRSFQSLLLRWKLHPHCHVMRLTSEKAVKYIKTIDFLHMDGDYSLAGSVRDVELYLPKVRKGGYILFSNLKLTVNEEQPKVTAFNLLLEHCEIVHYLDGGNAILLRKIVD